jgi:type II secretory pathway component HofQ
MKTRLTLLLATLALFHALPALAAKEDVEKKTRETHVTLQVKAVTAETALTLLSDLSGVPITLKNVREKKVFSLNVQDVPLRDAVDAVCRYYKLDWFATDTGITVRSGK